MVKFDPNMNEKKPPYILGKHDELKTPYVELGQRSLKSAHSISSKIYSLVTELKSNPDATLSAEDKATLNLIRETVPDLMIDVADLEDEERKKAETDNAILKAVPRYIEILFKENEKRTSDQRVIEAKIQPLPAEGFDEVAFVESLKSQFPDLNIVSQFIPNFPNQTKISQEYPKKDSRKPYIPRSLPDQKTIVYTDITMVTSLISGLERYVKYQLANEPGKAEFVNNEYVTQLRLVLDQLQGVESDQLFEEWKKTVAAKEPFSKASARAKITTQGVSIDDLKTQLSTATTLLSEIENAISAEQNIAGKDVPIKEHIDGKFVAPLKADIEILKDKVYENWKSDIDAELTELERLLGVDNTSVEQFQLHYQGLETELAGINGQREVWLQRLPEEVKKVGTNYLDEKAQQARDKMTKTREDQIDFLRKHEFGPTSNVVRELSHTVVKVRLQMPGSRDVDGLFAPLQAELVHKMEDIKREVDSQLQYIIDDNGQSILKDLKKELLQEAESVLNQIKDRIDEIEKTGKKDKISTLNAVITEILGLREDQVGTYTREYLASLKEDLSQARTDARGVGVNLSDLDNGEDLTHATTMIDRLIESRENPIHLTLEEIVDELLRLQVDPYNYGHLPEKDRGRQLAVEYDIRTDNALDNDFRNPEELKRIVHKMRAALVNMDVVLKAEDKTAATGNRSQLYTVMKQKKISRKEVLIAATYHPDWGELVREIIFDIVDTSVEAEYDDSIMISYNNLVGESGRDNLRIWMESQPRYQDIKPRPGETDVQRQRREQENKRRKTARLFASSLFTGYDILNDILRILQRRTRTASHNQKIKDTVDRRWVDDPASSAVHSLQRDGGTMSNSRGHWWVYQEVTDDYCASDEKREILREWQELERLRRVALQGPDVEVIFDSIEPQVERKGLFGSTLDLILLNEGESLDFNTGEANLYTHDRYETAESGWTDTLNFVTEKITNGLTEEDFIAQVKDDVNIIARWTKAVSRGKEFADAETYKLTFEPLFTDYIMRAFYALERTDIEFREQMFVKVVEMLDANGRDASLKGFQFELDLVIRNLMRNKPELWYTDGGGRRRSGDAFVRRKKPAYLKEKIAEEESRRGKSFTEKERRERERFYGNQFDVIAKEVAKNLRFDVEKFLRILKKKGPEEQCSKSLFDPFLYNHDNIINFVKAYYEFHGKSIPRSRGLPNQTTDDKDYFAYIDGTKALPTIFNNAKSDIEVEN